MKKPSKFTIQRAKRTLVGRLACRLLGEQTGAVLMEYVVLGVLSVAAVVAAVMMFGGSIKDAFATMARSIWGQPDKVQESSNQGQETTEGGIKTADDHMKNVQHSKASE